MTTRPSRRELLSLGSAGGIVGSVVALSGRATASAALALSAADVSETVSEGAFDDVYVSDSSTLDVAWTGFSGGETPTIELRARAVDPDGDESHPNVDFEDDAGAFEYATVLATAFDVTSTSGEVDALSFADDSLFGGDVPAGIVAHTGLSAAHFTPSGDGDTAAVELEYEVVFDADVEYLDQPVAATDTNVVSITHQSVEFVVAETYEYTGQTETHDVSDLDVVEAELSGAAGGDSETISDNGSGGSGGYLHCRIDTAALATMDITVGEQGTTGDGGGGFGLHNGGGASSGVGAGGGSTEIRDGDGNLIAAADAGGGGGVLDGMDTWVGGGGGARGGTGGGGNRAPDGADADADADSAYDGGRGGDGGGREGLDGGDGAQEVGDAVEESWEGHEATTGGGAPDDHGTVVIKEPE